jgi:arylsulfatase A-like enzyme
MKTVVVLIRGLNVALLGCYGNEWIATPALDRLAAESVVFDQHYVETFDPVAAQRSRETGCHCFYSSGVAPPPRPRQSLFSFLREVGVNPFPVGGELADQTLGKAGEILPQMANPAHAVLWVELPLPDPSQMPAGEHHPIDDHDEENLAADQQECEEPPEEDAEEEELLRLHENWERIMTHLDSRLGALLEELDRCYPPENTLLIVTGDCGPAHYELGDLPGMRPGLHEESIHLPLIVRLPGKAEAGRRVAALTQPVDLLPTLLEAFGVSPPETVHGRSLLALARGQLSEVRPYACMVRAEDKMVQWGLRTPEWFLMVRESSAETRVGPELYRKPEDRWEVNNLRQHYLELADRFEQTLRAFVEATQKPGPLQIPPLRVEIEQQRPGDIAQEGDIP